MWKSFEIRHLAILNPLCNAAFNPMICEQEQQEQEQQQEEQQQRQWPYNPALAQGKKYYITKSRSH